MNPQDPTVISPTPPIVPGQAEPVAVPPEVMFQPIAPPGPMPSPVAQQLPGAPIQPITNLPKPPKRNKKPLIVGLTLVGLLIVITVGAVLLGGKKKTNTATQTPTTTLQGPQPAQAIDVEQASNSISQDVSGHDNAKDFPNGELDDKTLGL